MRVKFLAQGNNRSFGWGSNWKLTNYKSDSLLTARRRHSVAKRNSSFTRTNKSVSFLLCVTLFFCQLTLIWWCVLYIPVMRLTKPALMGFHPIVTDPRDLCHTLMREQTESDISKPTDLDYFGVSDLLTLPQNFGYGIYTNLSVFVFPLCVIFLCLW